MGNETLFDTLAGGNSDLFRKHGVKKILTTSPHCYEAFKKDYAESHSGPFEVIHTSELLADLVAEGRLDLQQKPDQVVTYHDPCYLGRWNKIFDAPRSVLQALPGVTFKEMYRIRESSLCCGGGGGRMWMETKFGERFSDLRVPEALAVGAQTLVTACPYCVSMLEDSRKNLNQEESIRVMDVCELVAEYID